MNVTLGMVPRGLTSSCRGGPVVEKILDHEIPITDRRTSRGATRRTRGIELISLPPRLSSSGSNYKVG